MWQKILISLLFNTIYSIEYNTNDKNTLKNWFDQVKSPTFTCPLIKNEEIGNMKNDKTPPLVKVVDCTELGAIYQYDYRVIFFYKTQKNNNLQLELVYLLNKDMNKICGRQAINSLT